MQIMKWKTMEITVVMTFLKLTIVTNSTKIGKRKKNPKNSLYQKAPKINQINGSDAELAERWLFQTKQCYFLLIIVINEFTNLSSQVLLSQATLEKFNEKLHRVLLITFHFKKFTIKTVWSFMKFYISNAE